MWGFKKCGKVGCVFFLLLEEKNFCLIHYVDCVLAAPQIGEKSSVNRC